MHTLKLMKYFYSTIFSYYLLWKQPMANQSNVFVKVISLGRDNTLLKVTFNFNVNLFSIY